MSSIVIKRFIGGYTGHERYSIRKHSNGSFQVFHDNPYEGIPQCNEEEDHPLTGLFADAETAEAEFLRLGLLDKNST